VSSYESLTRMPPMARYLSKKLSATQAPRASAAQKTVISIKSTINCSV